MAKRRTVQMYTQQSVDLANSMSKEDWRRIKHMSKIEMALYIQGVYQQGFKAGAESVKPKVTEKKLEGPSEAPTPDPGGELDELDAPEASDAHD